MLCIPSLVGTVCLMVVPLHIAKGSACSSAITE